MKALPNSKAPSIIASKERSPFRQVLHGSFWYSLAIFVNRFVPGIQTVILAWWLGPRELGVVSFVLAYYGILSLVADWSIAYALQKLIPENPNRAGQVAGTALIIRIIFSTVLGLTCWTVDAGTGAFHGYGFYLALLLVASSFGIVVYIHNALRRFSTGSLLSVTVYVIWFPLTLLFVKVGMHVTGPILALCIGFVASGIPGFLLVPRLRSQVAFVRPIAIEILRFGAWGTLATLLSGVVDQVGILVVAYRIGDASAGIFKVATTFGVVPALLGMIVMLPLMPVAKQGLLNGDDVGSSLIRPIIRYLLMLGLPIAAAGFVLAQPVVRTFVGNSYLDAIWPMRILLTASLLRMLVVALSGVLFVGQDLKDLAKVHGFVAVIALFGSLLFVGFGGATAVALSSVVSWSAGALLLYRFFERKSRLRLEWGKYLRYLGSAVVTAGIVFSVSRLVHPDLAQLVLGGCVTGIAYLLLIFLQRDSLLEGAALKFLRSTR
jgi:O-antigen/teichoic acid export membrane protein